jgi:hypothetical protein
MVDAVLIGGSGHSEDTLLEHSLKTLRDSSRSLVHAKFADLNSRAGKTPGD